MNTEIKEYSYKENKFTFKKRNLKFRADSVKFRNQFLMDAKIFTEEAEINKNKYSEDSAEFKYWHSEFQKGFALATEMFCYDGDKLKHLFELCLDGDLTIINYECESDEDFKSLQLLGVEVLTDFFTFTTGLLTNPTIG